MKRLPIVLAAVIVGAAASWALSLNFGAGPLGELPALLLGADLLIVATVIAIGMVLSHGVWARRSALGLLAFLVALAFVQAPDLWWSVALATTCAAAIGVAGPWLKSRLREPPAARLPTQATILALGLLTLPGLVAVCGPKRITATGWLLAGLAAACAWGYARALPGFVWVTRLALPVVGVAAAVGLGWIGGIVLGGAVGALTLLAWSREAMMAVIPPAARRAKPVPIPPELVPREVLDAAGVDERGQRRADG